MLILAQSGILSLPALGPRAERAKVIKVVIPGVLARAKTEHQGIPLSPPESTSGLYMAQNYLVTPDRYPELPLCAR